jgi:hypothetical protein
MTDHVAFFGDAERAFALNSPALIAELERKTNAGIGGLAKRLFAGDFRHAEVSEIIRLGLIGGGASPEEAAALVAAYVTARPLVETYGLAVSIMEVLWLGSAKDVADVLQAEEAVMAGILSEAA